MICCSRAKRIRFLNLLSGVILLFYRADDCFVGQITIFVGQRYVVVGQNEYVSFNLLSGVILLFCRADDNCVGQITFLSVNDMLL